MTTPTHGDQNHSMTYTIKVRAPLLTLSKQTQHVHSERRTSYASSKLTLPKTPHPFTGDSTWYFHPSPQSPQDVARPRSRICTAPPSQITRKPLRQNTKTHNFKRKKKSISKDGSRQFSFAASSKVSRFYDTSKPSISSCQHASPPCLVFTCLVFSLLSFPFIQQITPLAKKASKHDISPPTPGSTAKW